MLRRVGNDENFLTGNLANAFPRNSPAMLIGGEAFDETDRATCQRYDSAVLDLNFVNAAERLAIERLHLGVADLA